MFRGFPGTKIPGLTIVQYWIAKQPYLTMITIMDATTKPRITIVSGIASSTIMLPVDSGFSAMVAAPAAPILDCARPVAIAPPANAIAAPIGTSQDNFSTPLIRKSDLILYKV